MSLCVYLCEVSVVKLKVNMSVLLILAVYLNQAEGLLCILLIFFSVLVQREPLKCQPLCFVTLSHKLPPVDPKGLLCVS